MNTSLRFGRLQTTCYRLGYAWIDDGDYNLNIIAVRAKQKTPQQFNDVLCIAFRIDGRPLLFTFPCATDPNIYWRHQIASIDHHAIVVPGQYSGAWKADRRRGQYPVLANIADVDLLAALSRQAQLRHGQHFTYTLIDEAQLT